jgi:nucleotide-binding universal stress UspA family protein
MMFRHLLVTIDGSRASEAVIPYAIEVAKRLDARLTLIRVVNTTGAAQVKASERGSMGKPRSFDAAREWSEHQALDYLEKQAQKARHFGLDVDVLVRSGDPATEILAAADAVGADTIGMATHSRRGLDRLMMGSIAEQVVHLTSMPVLLLRVD